MALPRIDLKDPRTPRLFGLFLLFLAAYLGLAFISYIFTWKDDQSAVLTHAFELLLTEIRVSNLLGRFGAVLSNFFIYYLFGLPSFFMIYAMFLYGKTIVNGDSTQPLAHRRMRILLWMLTFSVMFGFIFHASDFPWGGNVGYSISEWLLSLIGAFGVIVLILFSLSALFLWTFNPETKNMTFSKAMLTIKEFITNLWNGRYRSNPLGETARVTGAELGNPIVDDPKEPITEPSLAPIRGELGAVEEILAKSKSGSADIEITLKEIDESKKPLQSTISELEITSPTVTEGVLIEPISVGDEAVPSLIPEGLQANLFDSNNPAGVPRANSLNMPYDPRADLSHYKFPPLSLLNTYDEGKIEVDRLELEQNKDQIIETLLNYKIEITKIRATVGPTVTLYEIVPAPGVRISRIKNLEDDIALSLAALGIRIIAPIPGRGTIGIEVPNRHRQTVSLREVLASERFHKTDMDLPIALGKNISNEVIVADLAKMPHLLIAGATGQGKSVGINTILLSLFYKKHPAELKVVLIDPKKVELSPYSKIENHFLAFMADQEEPIITDTSKVVQTLTSLCREMDTRYDLLKKAQARNIKEYNEKFIARRLNPEKGHNFMPFIVLVIDEFADLIMTAGKEVELPIGRLAQLARAVGIHLIIATQRPSVNIITGVIKANFPARLAFKVTSKIDSRTILDGGGAEQLIGRGDMLLSSGADVIRLQCAFVDTPEVERVVSYVSEQQGYPVPFFLPEVETDETGFGNGNKGLSVSDLDDMLEDAARLVVQNQHGSTSMIQRRLKLGYNRAGRIMDQLESLGIVGPNEGSKPREVLFSDNAELDRFFASLKSKR